MKERDIGLAVGYTIWGTCSTLQGISIARFSFDWALSLITLGTFVLLLVLCIQWLNYEKPKRK